MTPAIIDFSHLEMIGGIADPELREIMEEFIDSIPEYLVRAGNAISAEDAKQLREAAHSLRGVAGSLGFQLLSITAAEADLNIPPTDPREWLARMTRHCEETVTEWNRLKKGSTAES